MPNSTLDCLDMEGFDNSKSLYVPREMYNKRGELLKHTKKTMDSALRSLKAIGNSSYMPIMNRLEGMIEMIEKELADA